MILDRIQHYLGVAFLTLLIITQASVFVAVKASNNDDLLRAVFVEPLSENITIDESVYFQAMLSNSEDSQFDLVYFNLKNFNTGLDENYEASLQADGSWLAQSMWDTSYGYQPGEYYLSVVAQDNSEEQLENIYYSQAKLINLNGEYQAAVENALGYFEYPSMDTIVNPNVTDSLTVVLYLNSEESARIPGLQFKLIGLLGEGSDENNNDFNVVSEYLFPELAVKLGEDSANPGYDRWEATMGLSNVEDSTAYLIEIMTTLSDGSDIEIPSGFTISRASTTAVPVLLEPMVTEILSPSNLQEFLLTDNLLVEVSIDRPLPPGSIITMETKPDDRTTTLTIISEKTLVQDINNPLHYHYTLDLDAVRADDMAEDGVMQGEDVYGFGDYVLNLFLVDTNHNRPDLGLEHLTFSVVRGTEEEVEVVKEVILNNPAIEAGLVEGDTLDLNFETNFSAEYFNFAIVKEDDSTLGILIEPAPVGDGTSWVYTVSAAENGFTNGRYVLNAGASVMDEVTALYGPIVFNWQITEEDIPVEPSLAIHVSDQDFSPGSILIASANILEPEFILQDSSNEELFYSFAPRLVDCASAPPAIISQSIKDLALTLRHNNCFYYTLSSEDIIKNGNYYLFLQRESATEPVAVSTREIVTYFDEDNQVDEDTIFELKGPYPGRSTDGNFMDFPFLTNLSQDDLQFILFFIDAQKTTTSNLPNIIDVDWQTLEQVGIKESDYPDVSNPQVYRQFIKYKNNNILEGDYYAYVTKINGTLETDKIYFSIQDGVLLDSQSDAEQEENEVISEEDIIAEDILEDIDLPIQGQPEKTSARKKLTIDFYSTCYEEGISDAQTCARFRATMDLLDPTCVEQGIYEDVACEDYLYRIESDLECQENSIIDREQCKNYLLEKYGSQVDCQLADANLCNSILRNEYLNRLASGQKASQNINQAIDSLIGQNISTQDLSDTLDRGGVDSKKVLPLSPNQNTKVLLSRSQKETVLEEKNRLTILNQAIIILDTDGDGLSDDLEAYYGTEVNNSDTDGDGYSDGEEIANGYDPIGPGKLIKERTNFDIVTLDKEKIIEQPKIKSKKIDNKMEVFEVDAQKDKLNLSGKAEANTWVNLYLYSGLPLVMTTKTDASGNWSYDIKDSVNDGHHRVFVTVNDDTGRIVKQSRPISFLIKEAQAVTANDYFDEASSGGTTNSLFIYYILGGVFLVFLALGVIVLLHKGKNRDLEV